MENCSTTFCSVIAIVSDLSTHALLPLEMIFRQAVEIAKDPLSAAKLASETCLRAYERYGATLGPCHPRASAALDGLWKAFRDLDEDLEPGVEALHLAVEPTPALRVPDAHAFPDFPYLNCK